jgi:hypothetical protein
MRVCMLQAMRNPRLKVPTAAPWIISDPAALSFSDARELALRQEQLLTSLTIGANRQGRKLIGQSLSAQQRAYMADMAFNCRGFHVKQAWDEEDKKMNKGENNMQPQDAGSSTQSLSQQAPSPAHGINSGDVNEGNDEEEEPVRETLWMLQLLTSGSSSSSSSSSSYRESWSSSQQQQQRQQSVHDDVDDVSHNTQRLRLTLDDCIDSECALCKLAVVSRVCSYMSSKEYLFVAGISKLWHRCYTAVHCTGKQDKHSSKGKQQQQQQKQQQQYQQVCTTSMASAVQNTAKLQWCFDGGLTVPQLTAHNATQSFAEHVVTLSSDPIGVLTLCKLRDLSHQRWLTDVPEFAALAALHCNTELLRWLHEHGFDWNEQQVLLCAAVGNAVDVLHWRSTDAPPEVWTAPLMQNLLWCAGCSDALNTAQWLHAQGASWPEKFVRSETAADGRTVSTCWPVRLVQWALSEGSTWCNWRCQDMIGKWFHCRDRAQELYKWAHMWEHRWPCTCSSKNKKKQQLINEEAREVAAAASRAARAAAAAAAVSATVQGSAALS